MSPQDLDVLEQQLGRVVSGLAERGRPTGAALVEQDDAVVIGIEEAPMQRPAARTGSAVQKQDRHPGGPAGRSPQYMLCSGSRLNLPLSKGSISG